MKLTEEQEVIISYSDKPDNLIISALAGTGKTTTLSLLAKEIDKHVPRGRKLAVSFSLKSVEDLRSKMPENWQVSTFNSIGNSAIKETFGWRHISVKKTEFIVKEHLQGSTLEKQDYFDLLSLIALAKNAGIVPKERKLFKGLTEDTEEVWESLLSKLDNENKELITIARRVLSQDVKESLQKSGTISLDDQIYLSIYDVSFPRFDIIMVDEAQDTNPLQHLMLSKMAKRARLIIVGDRNQAIYHWRGASANAMEELRSLKEQWTELNLTYSFRVPHAVAKRQIRHVPNFKSHESNPEGKVIHLLDWSLNDIPDEITVLCRNNAPLAELGFKFITDKRGFKILGSASMELQLLNLADKIFPRKIKNKDDCRGIILTWAEKQLKSGSSPEKIERVYDKADCLLALLGNDSVELKRNIKSIFKSSEEKIVMSTIHRFKGLESENVLFLDPWRIPSKYTLNKPDLLLQEHNLRYVGETRAKKVLIFANVDRYKTKEQLDAEIKQST